MKNRSVRGGDIRSNTLGGTQIKESALFIVTSNTSARAMLVTCKVNNHGGADGNVHCIGVR